MKIEVKNISIDKIVSDILLLGVFEDKKNPLEKLLSRKDEFEAKKGDVLVVSTQGKLPASKISFLGLGKSKDVTCETVRNAAAKGIKQAISSKAKNVAVSIESESINDVDLAQVISEGLILGSYKFTGYHKDKKSDFIAPAFATIVAESKSQVKEFTRGAKIGEIVSDCENLARDLVNAPSNKITPEYCANYAKKMATEVGLKCTILDPVKEGMECLWAVAKGSRNLPKIVVLKYLPSSKKDFTAIIGKGVTFDSGGISIKPSSKMWEMKTDMAGAAAVIEAMRAISKLKINQNIIAIIPLVENMPDGGASRPGDVVGSLDGTTVEIISTDAEGRMILADAITYAKNLGAKKIFDCATLTGGCITALGDVASGLLGNNGQFINEIKEAAKKSGEKVWHLPLFEEYKEYLKSDVADIKNCMDRGMASASTGGTFLHKFVGDTPWVHLDIAGTALLGKGSGCCPTGATGVPLRTIVEWLRTS